MHNNLVDYINQLQDYDHNQLKEQWEKIRPSFKHKIVVLDDDPTGVQTVHGISVYTDWESETIEEAFLEDNQMFFVLTNSRSFSEEKTTEVHQQIARRVEEVSKKTHTSYLLISRGDSTLRGHYPLETDVLRQDIESRSASPMDGEILIPFFKEGGRYTIQGTHFVQSGDEYIPPENRVCKRSDVRLSLK